MTCETTRDTFYQGGVSLLQPKDGYRFGTDAMLLAACVPLKNGDSVLELGCGVGAVLHALAFRAKRDGLDVQLTGIELQPAMADLAKQNAAANDFQLHIINGDACDKTLCPLGSFDHVICNPPYHPCDCSSPANNDCRTTAHIESVDGLKDWIQAANRFLKPKGRFTMIHRADRLDEYLPLCSKFLGGITLVPFWPKAGQPAKRMVLTGKKGCRSDLAIHPGLVLHDAAGGYYTADADAVICRGQAINL